MENKGKEENEEKIEPKKKKNQFGIIVKNIWKMIGIILMIIITFISIIIVTQRITNNEHSFLGFRIFRVQTGSMIPKYLIGDVILVKEKNIDQIQEGEDVTYIGTTGAMKGKLVTHRVIKIEEIDGQRAFHTQGIANTKEDPIVYGEQINGVVQCRLNSLTWICNGLNNKYIFYFCGIIPLTIYIFFCIVKGKSEAKRN